MPSIIVKFQRCGKNNCHCINGDYHGPYYWFVIYKKARNNFKKGKYKWRYIGKNSSELKRFLDEISSKMQIKSSLEEIVKESENKKKSMVNSAKANSGPPTLKFR